MNILLVGYGYVTRHLLAHLGTAEHTIWIISRSQKPEQLSPSTHYMQSSADTARMPTEHFDQVFYTIPPSDEYDNVLQGFLDTLQGRANTLIYCGASSVYGDYHGDWVDERSPCNAKTPREKKRLHAERLCLDWAQKASRIALILRVAGIYGPGQLPISAARCSQPLIEPREAPWSNVISVYDLVYSACYLAQHARESALFNIADGNPIPMGSLQAMVAEQLGLPAAPYQAYSDIYRQASPMRQEFMKSSKRLSIAKLLQALPKNHTLLELREGVARALKESPE